MIVILRKRWKLSLLAGACFVSILSLATIALSLDPPHDYASESVVCVSCHNLHAASGMQLTSVAGNPNLCMSCHKAGGSAEGLRFSDIDKAIPGTSGTSHAWGVPAVHAAYETRLPTITGMLSRLDSNNNIVCSTCHDQHDNEDSGAYWGRTLRAAIPNTTNTSTAYVVAGGTYTGTTSETYIITINGANFDWTRKYGGGGATGVSRGVDVALENGILVSFYLDGGSFADGDTWTIRASIPFLRANNTSDAMCKDCHYKWSNNNNYNRISTDASPNITTYSGTEYHSHPVGYALNANGKGYDFATPQALTGTDQYNESNNLPLDGSNQVQCTTCHRIHFSNSNSSEKDGRY